MPVLLEQAFLLRLFYKKEGEALTNSASGWFVVECISLRQ